MIVSVVLLQVILPVFALGATVCPLTKKFDYDSLSLREVGSRNTMASTINANPYPLLT